MADYVCWTCRYRHGGKQLGFGHETPCLTCGKPTVYAHVMLPASRDDHKMWKLAEEMSKPRKSGMRRRHRRGRRTYAAATVMEQWEKDLLRAAR